MRKKALGHRSQGQAVVLVALALIVLVGMVGLGVDGGNAFNQRRHTNNAADAAAMAATRVLVVQKKNGGNGAPISAAITQYLNQHLSSGSYTAVSNYIDRHAAIIKQVDNSSVPSNAQGIVVDVQYTFNTFFMPVFRRDTLTVGGSGMAFYGPIGSTIGADLIPLVITQTAFETFKNSGGADISIMLYGPAAGSYQIAPGNFGQVSYDPGGSNQTGNYSQDCIGDPATHQDSQSRWWCQGSQYQIQIGQLLDGQTGALSNSLGQQIDWRINNRPMALVPVVAAVSGSGNNTTFGVVGFMGIELVDAVLTGPNPGRKVIAKYVDYYAAPGAIVDQGNGLDTGAYAINLVR